ncbi:MAG: HAD family hydrolase [Pseudomonadota bacterium]
MKIAMWSGPRNLSTAMMYSFGSRGDLAVWDEPFYGAYLAETGIAHPMREEVLATWPTSAEAVAQKIATMGDATFLKLMSFHMLPGFPMAWAGGFTHIHLLRHPARVIASYTRKRERPTARDIGFEEQLALFEACPGPVIDTAEIRADPSRALQKLCAEIGLPWHEAMLAWPAGPKPFDGVWAPHWYDAVHRSTGFASAEGPLPELVGEESALLARVLPAYEALARHTI